MQVASRFFAEVSVQVRYFRYELLLVFISIALYMILMAFWMPRPVTDELLQVGTFGLPPLPRDSRTNQWSPGPAAACTSEPGIELE